MTIIAQDNFDSDTVGSIAPGWVNKIGTWAVIALDPISGANAFGSSTNADGDIALFTSAGTLGDQQVSTSQKVVKAAGEPAISHIVRSSDASFTNGYVMLVSQIGGTQCRIDFYRRTNGGFTQIAGNTAPLAIAAGDTLAITTKMVGAVCSVYLGKDTPSSTAAGSFTDTSYSSGYPGLYYGRDANNVTTTIDNFVLTDGATATVNNALTSNTASVLFSPDNWDIQASTAKTINAGAYLKFLFGGTSCTLNFDMTGLVAPLPQITYQVDRHGPIYSQEVAASVALNIPADTSDYATKPGHLVELRVKSMTETQARWSPQATAVRLTGILLDTVATISAPPALPLKGIFYGDSITEGVRTVNNTAANDTDRNDSGQCWSLEVGRILGAEVGNVGFGGSGFTVTGSGGVPVLASTYNFLYSGVARSFSSSPNFIVMMESTNDGTNDVTSSAAAVLNGLIASTTAKIIVLRPFKDATHASQLQAAIAACTAPSRCTYVDTANFFNSANSSDVLHPYGAENLTHIAPMVANVIRSILAGTYGLTTRTASFTVRNAAGPMANLTNLQVSIFDDPTRAVGSPIRYQTLVGTTDANGLFTATYQSVLPSGGTCGIDVRGAGVNMAINPTVT